MCAITYITLIQKSPQKGSEKSLAQKNERFLTQGSKCFSIK